jgi:hypothetical protein
MARTLRRRLLNGTRIISTPWCRCQILSSSPVQPRRQLLLVQDPSGSHLEAQSISPSIRLPLQSPPMRHLLQGRILLQENYPILLTLNRLGCQRLAAQRLKLWLPFPLALPCFRYTQQRPTSIPCLSVNLEQRQSRNSNGSSGCGFGFCWRAHSVSWLAW